MFKGSPRVLLSSFCCCRCFSFSRYCECHKPGFMIWWFWWPTAAKTLERFLAAFDVFSFRFVSFFFLVSFRPVSHIPEIESEIHPQIGSNNQQLMTIKSSCIAWARIVTASTDVFFFFLFLGYCGVSTSSTEFSRTSSDVTELQWDSSLHWFVESFTYLFLDYRTDEWCVVGVDKSCSVSLLLHESTFKLLELCGFFMLFSIFQSETWL